mgnify:CR=1 FL=1
MPDFGKYEKFVSDWHYFAKEMGQKIKSFGSEGQEKSKALCLYILKKFYMEPLMLLGIFMSSLTRDWRKRNMQQLPKEFIGKNGAHRSVYRSGGSLLRRSSYFWNACSVQFNLTTSRNQVPLTSVKIEGEKVLIPENGKTTREAGWTLRNSRGQYILTLDELEAGAWTQQNR